MSAEYEFDLRAVDCDREGYYFPRWDRAQKITVVATTKQAAINQAAAVLGDPPRGKSGWYWGFKVDAIRPARSAVTP